MNASRALVACVLLASAPARAQKADADAEFKRGKALMAQQKYAEACAAFDKSQELDPKVSVVMNQANCREKNGQLATARKLFEAAAAQTDRASDAAGVQLHGVALDRAAKLGDRVSTLTLDVPAASRVAGLVIKRGTDVVDPVSWGSAVMVDGGTYTIDVSAPDHVAWSTTVTVAGEKDHKTVSVPALQAVAKPAETKPVEPLEKPTDTNVDTPIATPPTAVKATETGVTVTTPAPRRSRLPAYLVGGAGVALIGVGAIVMVSAKSTYDDAVVEGDDGRQYQLWQSANHKLYVGEALAGAGLAAAAVGVWLYIRGGERESPRAALHVQPRADGGAVVLEGRY